MISTTKENSSPIATNTEDYYKALSVIAHNAKGPVKYIHYVTQYTLDNWDSMTQEDLYNCAQIVNEAAKNIDVMLANLLVWAKLKEGSIHAVKVQLLVSNIIAEEVALYRPFLKLKKINLENKMDSDTIARTDVDILRIIFQNILSNAVKFSPQESKIIIETKKRFDNTIQISVTDFGVGFSIDEKLASQEKDNSSIGTLNEIGSGYGLKMSRDLLNLIDGKLEVESGGGKPTIVSIILPAK